MKTTNKVIIASMLVAIMLIGVGYALIQNITLNITGSATANPNDANFGVKFAETTEVSDASKVTAAITNDTNATINVVGLTSAGETVTATYTVQNTSTDLSADLSVETTNDNTEYFEITSQLGKTSIVAGEATTLTVTVELLKTPIVATEKATMGIQLTAVPVQPGEEGTSGGTTGGKPTETTTLASLTNDNIGDYIDFGNNVVGTESTSDDWRILYVDETGVFAILADYLPNSTNYAVNAGLDTMGTYGVYSNKDIDTFLTALTTSSNWNHLANGINGAEVLGTPYMALEVASYYVKTGNLIDESNPILDPNTADYDLYIPHSTKIDNCEGYWVADIDETKGGRIYNVQCAGYAYSNLYDYPYLAIRPAVLLPRETAVEEIGNVWTIPEELTNGKTNGGVEKEDTTGQVDTTLATVTNANIGEYIDLGNNIVGGTETTDDWKILYVENNKVYAILTDYLPNSTGYAKNAGLDISNTETEDYVYILYSKTDRDTLLNGITTEANWQGLANGISGATVTGSPTADLLMKSYKAKNGTTLDYTKYPKLDASYLYLPRIDKAIDGCWGYWLASAYEGNANGVWELDFGGNVNNDWYGDAGLGVRPVVCLSSDTNVTREGKLWTVKQ